MAAYAALVSLLNNVEQMMKHPRISASLDDEQIQPLIEKAGFLLEFIEGYNLGGGDSKEAEDVERQIASAAHAAEDVIESHIVDQIQGDSSLTISCLITLLLKCTGCHVEARDGSKNTLDLNHISEEMDSVMETVKGFIKEQQPPTHSRAAAALMETTGEKSTTRMVGLDDELLQLLDELTGQQSSRHTISIVGMGGTGKTTLAKNVYQNQLIVEHFQCRAWATVAENHDEENILSQLLSGLGISTSTSAVDQLGEQLHKALSGRRYLIVLDDVWSVAAWDKVRRFFPDYGNRSRVLLTTRMSNVARDCGSSSFPMNLLDESKSWNLFCEKVALNQHGNWPPQLEEIGKEIVKLCKGLALSIVVIGGLLLKAPRTVEYWEEVVRDLKSSIPNSKEKQESLAVLSLSYNHLPPRLKPCFLYLGVFEEDSQIRVSNIFKLWVGEGFVKPDGGRDLEEIAEGYLKELIDRNLILVGRLRQNGKIGSFGIHDLLRDLCLKVAKQQDFFHVSEGMIGGAERRLVCTSYLSQVGRPLARSIMTLPKCHSAYSVRYRLLRVLHVSKQQDSPEDLYGNVNLRYLSYIHPADRQSLWKLPTSISLAWNLQTLIIKDFLSLFPIVVAPAEIWKMRQLRHVKCHRIYLPEPDEEDDLLILDKLRTLKRVVNLRLSEEMCKMIPNIKKLHLLYDWVLHRYGYGHDLIECVCNLEHLHQLESLNLGIRSGRRRAPDPYMYKKLRFPNSLNKLTLSGCQLHWDNLTIIGLLPHLQVLELEMNSVTVGERWSPVDGQFLHLKFLKIDGCLLIHWDADNSHFPVLEILNLCDLRSLKEIPGDIGEIPTLKLIRVECCSESTAVSAVKIKEDQLETQEDDSLLVQVKVFDSRLMIFKETLKQEGLTLDNFQLEINPYR